MGLIRSHNFLKAMEQAKPVLTKILSKERIELMSATKELPDLPDSELTIKYLHYSILHPNAVVVWFLV